MHNVISSSIPLVAILLDSLVNPRDRHATQPGDI
jgi:hypothetical protein